MGVRSSRLRGAVFLDRDGTIIRQVELLHKISEVKLLPAAARAMRALNKLGYLVIVVTNQPVVARGIITLKEVDKIHAFLVAKFKESGAKIDAVYFCPHHPEATLKKYRIRCRCRKPNIGMIVKAAKKLGINLKKSFMVGDSTRDVLAGNRAKLRTILVKTGYSGKDPWQFKSKPDFVVKNLDGAVKVIRNFS